MTLCENNYIGLIIVLVGVITFVLGYIAGRYDKR